MSERFIKTTIYSATKTSFNCKILLSQNKILVSSILFSWTMLSKIKILVSGILFSWTMLSKIKILVSSMLFSWTMLSKNMICTEYSETCLNRTSLGQAQEIEIDRSPV